MQNTAYDSERRPSLILVTDSDPEAVSEVDAVEYAVWATSVQMTVYPPEMRTWSKHLAVLDAYLF